MLEYLREGYDNMIIYIKSTRDARDFYTSYTGLSEEVARALLTDLGCTNISMITEQEFLESLPISILGE